MSARQESAKSVRRDDNADKDSHLKGTFISVLILGGFIALTWLGVFILFIVRNGG
jgi:hypothetical protein